MNLIFMKKINNNFKKKIRCGFFPAILGASTTAKWGMITAISSAISLFTSFASSFLNITTNASSDSYIAYNENDSINIPTTIKQPAYISNTINPSIKIF